MAFEKCKDLTFCSSALEISGEAQPPNESIGTMHVSPFDPCGLSKQAVRTISTKDVDWADVVFVMEADHRSRLQQSFRSQLTGKVVECLDIPDDYQLMDPELIELLTDRINHFLDQHLLDHGEC